MNFKDEFYGSYYRTHVLPRKGEVSKKQLDKKRKVFELHFREFLPADTGAAIVDAGCGSGGVVYWLHGAGYPNASTRSRPDRRSASAISKPATSSRISRRTRAASI